MFFEQKQCPNYDVLRSRVLRDPPTRAMAEKFRCVQLDMWSNEKVATPAGVALTAREWAKQLDVKYAPMSVLSGRDGQEVIRSEAWFRTFHRQSIFDYVCRGAYRSEPEFQRHITDRADRLREDGTEVDIWE